MLNVLIDQLEPRFAHSFTDQIVAAAMFPGYISITCMRMSDEVKVWQNANIRLSPQLARSLLEQLSIQVPIAEKELADYNAEELRRKNAG